MGTSWNTKPNRWSVLRREKEGRVRHCRLVAGPIKEAAMWIADYSRFWEERLDALETQLWEIQHAVNALEPSPRPLDIDDWEDRDVDAPI